MECFVSVCVCVWGGGYLQGRCCKGQVNGVLSLRN
jgi:hypothetical protein